MKGYSKVTRLLSLGFLAAGCATQPKINYGQAYETDLANGQVTLAALNALDAGDVSKARKVGMQITV